MLKVLKYTFPKSIKQNGVIWTLIYLAQIFLIKANVSKHVLLKNGWKVTLRNGTSDVPVFRQIFLEGEYNYPFGIKPKYIIDAGANVGLASVYFKSRYPDAKIIAIEPEPENFKRMLKNIENLDDVTPLNAGIWNKDTVLSIISNGNLGEWGTQLVNEPGKNEIQCYSVESILKLVEFPRIDIFKIDIEGAEKELFLENNDLSWLYSTKILVIEIHDFLIKGLTDRLMERINNSASFKVDKVGENTVLINTEI